MRTISNTHKKRLIAQAEEADFQGHTKLANNLNSLVKQSDIRSDNEEYVYSHNDLTNDTENLLWAAALRIQDYFDKTANAQELNELITSYATELISDIKVQIGGNIIGPHEPLVPGEQKLIVEIEED